MLFDKSNRKFEHMKRIILIIIILTGYFSGFSQSLSGNNSFPTKLNFEENSAVSEVKIYPNPCKEEKVTVEFINQEIREIRLTNIIGKEVFFKQYPFSENKKQIELTEIPNGIYLIQIKTTDGEFVVKKLMVARN